MIIHILGFTITKSEDILIWLKHFFVLKDKISNYHNLHLLIPLTSLQVSMSLHASLLATVQLLDPSGDLATAHKTAQNLCSAKKDVDKIEIGQKA